jgi:Peptidase_C39 like family
VTRTILRSLRAITGNHTQSTVLGVAAVAIIGGLAAGPLYAAAAPHTSPVTAVTDSAKAAVKPASKPAATKPAPAAKSLKHDPALQPNGYYCGPAATRIALSAVKKAPSHDRLAKQLGTTTAGTNSVDDITRVLNKETGSKRYDATKIPNKTLTTKQVAKLRADIVSSVTKGEPVVANIAGTVTDNAGARHSYEGGHYLTVVGYEDNGKTAKITDPADREGGNSYKISTKKLANWMATRGYSS